MLTLALRIGASTAVFSLVSTILLKPLPYPNAERLLMIWRGGPIAISSGDDFPWSPFEFAVLARTATRLMARFLYGVGTADPLTFGLVSLLLIATTLTACYVPGRQGS